MKKLIVLCLIFISHIAASQAIGGEEEPEDVWYSRIYKSDIPTDAPIFEQYVVQNIFRGNGVRANIKHNPQAKLFKTVIQNQEEGDVNFAGVFRIIEWGCGAGCISVALLNKKTGELYLPKNIKFITNVAAIFEDEGGVNYEANSPVLDYLADSTLLIIKGSIDDGNHPLSSQLGISYFLWDNQRLKLIRFVRSSGK